MIVHKEHSVNIVANLTTPPKECTVFEGWLADVAGLDHELSVGELSKNGTLLHSDNGKSIFLYTIPCD